MKRKKTIRICSREWDFVRMHGKKMDGLLNGSFSYDPTGGIIEIDTGRRCNREILRTTIHEILESILTVDSCRWAESPDRIMFCFDHNYLNGLDARILDALISCGMVDPEKRVI